MKQPSEYRNQRVVVLGMAKSGTAVAKLFHAYGAHVTINDQKAREHCPEAVELEALGIEVICGGHPEDLLTGQVMLMVKNPGIPYSAAPVVRAQQLGIEIVTEVEVAYQVCGTQQMIGITGSNGKTTTTTWIGQTLALAGLPTTVAGNIGRALCDVALVLTEREWLVAELSSFQLMGTASFAPRISVLLNFAETHLDYHGTMQAYVEAKAKLFSNQQTTDFAVLNADDALVLAAGRQILAQKVLFSARQTLTEGVFLRDQTIVYRGSLIDGTLTEIELLQTAEIGIPGKHNVENALAVCAVALIAGVPVATIRTSLREFRGVEHRLEAVATKANVRYYNDSKATNPQATIKAIDGFAGEVILIAGGLDRGADYMELLEIFREKVVGLIALGETREKLAHVARLAGVPQIEVVAAQDSAQSALQAAVAVAHRWAQPQQVVLLSPACASWDMFPSYEVRGRMFKESVHTLV